MKWETVIGLEVHAELSTRSKIFCSCSTNFGAEPNTQVCPTCSGMPGALPHLNKKVVEYAIKLGLSLGCDINEINIFDRKNYFYPDLPKAYQVSQLYSPICRNGGIDLGHKFDNKFIRIHQIHMEEDAGKLIHDHRGGRTFMDYNRGGTPLLEIVSKPDFNSAEEVLAYLEKLREILLYLDICDCKMQEGSFRADVNLSVRPINTSELGTRTETKNLNSFKAIARAIEYETDRQIDMLESGGHIVQETRRWDDDLGESYGMRSKENAQDYRYFPEPDLLPISIDDAWLNQVRESLPEMAHQKRERYARDFGVAADSKDIELLTSHKNISDLFEILAENSGEPKESANLITGEIMRLMNTTNTMPEDLSIDAGKLVKLMGMLLGGKINRSAYKEAVEVIFVNNADPEAYIAEKGLEMVTDAGAAASIVDTVIAANQSAVADYKAGKQKAFGFLMGQVMKELGGSGNPAVVKEEMIKKLESL